MNIAHAAKIIALRKWRMRTLLKLPRLLLCRDFLARSLVSKSVYQECSDATGLPWRSAQRHNCFFTLNRNGAAAHATRRTFKSGG
jgi:hypothetical protein